MTSPHPGLFASCVALAIWFPSMAGGQVPEVDKIEPANLTPGSAMKLHVRNVGDSGRVNLVLSTLSGADVRLDVRIRGGAGDPGLVKELHALVPEAAVPGRWQLTIEENGRISAPRRLTIRQPQRPVLRRVSPALAHPGEIVWLEVRNSANGSDIVELQNSSGVWQSSADPHVAGLAFVVPENTPEGVFEVRTRRSGRGGDLVSNALRMQVTEGPRALDAKSLSARPVGAGQWTDVNPGNWINEFEMGRADQLEAEFAQRGQTFVAVGTGWLRRRLQVPGPLRPGRARVRLRTYHRGEWSEWSDPFTLMVTIRAVPPLVDELTVTYGVVWSRWHRGGDKTTTVAAGESLYVHGQFPVAEPALMRVRLASDTEERQLVPLLTDSGLQVTIPHGLKPGSWELTVNGEDNVTPQSPIVVIVRAP